MRTRLHILPVLVLALATASAETEIDIRGMESKSKSEVLRLIAGRLVYIRKKAATPWRANDAAFIIENILRNDGYYEVSVTAKVEATDRIALLVSEGKRLSLGAVTITGDADVQELTEIFETPFKSDTPFGAGSAPFRADDVPTALDFVTRKLKSEGYWAAEVTLAKQDIDKETGAVNMQVAVDRGPRFKIGQPTVTSPDGRGVKRTATTWQPFVGRWASTENVNGLRAAVEEAFTSRGYPDATITMTPRLGTETYYPDFLIDLGVRVKLLDVNFNGLEKTKPRRVEQIMTPLEGDWYDEAAMNDKVRDLLATGAFESVRIETNQVARKRINATLHFEEAKARELNLSAGAGSFNGPLFRAAYIDRNFRGMLRGFSVGTELSARGVLGELKLTDPWWRGTEILRTYRLYSLIKGYDGYTAYDTGLESSWELDVTDHYSLKLLIGYSYTVVMEKELPPGLLGELSYGHPRISFTQTWDYRDSKILPKAGWHLSVPLQLGAAIGDKTNTYVKFGLDGGWYFPLNDTYNFGVGGFANWVFPSGDIQDLPVDLRVFNGGARSVRSFPERDLGPSSDGDPYGGDFSWAVNTEISRKITGSLTAVAFVDAGAVTGSYTGIREGGLELAAGVGLRLELPIGPVRLEYGHNLTQNPKEPSGTFHFAIGATF